MIAVTFGTMLALKASKVIIKLLMSANKKLLAGNNVRLAIAIGIVKTNRDRPFASSMGVSLNVATTVSNKRNKDAAIVLDRLFTL